MLDKSLLSKHIYRELEEFLLHMVMFYQECIMMAFQELNPRYQVSLAAESFAVDKQMYVQPRRVPCAMTTVRKAIYHVGISRSFPFPFSLHYALLVLTIKFLCQSVLLFLTHFLFYSQTTEVEVPNIPHIPSKGVHRVPFRPCDLYIERNDFREVS